MQPHLSAEAPPIAYDIVTAVRVSTISRSRLYELIAAGKLASTTIGKRRVILADSLHRLLQDGC